MSQNLTAYAIGQVPRVTRPDLLDMKIMSQLTADSFDRATKPFTFTQLIRRQRGRLAIFRGDRKLKSLLCNKLLMKRLREIRVIPQKHPAIPFGQFWEHANIVHIGRGQIEGLDHTERVDFDVQAKSIKSLIAQLFAVRRHTLEELAEPGSGKSTDRDREAIDHGHNIPKPPGNICKEALFNLPEVGRVTNETHPAGEWEVGMIKISEESEDVFVRVKPQHFPPRFPS